MEETDPAYNVSLVVDIAAVLKTENVPAVFSAPAKLVPYFRYTLFNGGRVLTDPVGKSGSWAVVTPPSAEGAAVAVVDPKAKAPAKPAPGAKAVEVVAPTGPTLVRHTTSVDSLKGDLSLGRAIHSAPVLHVFMGLKPEETAVAAGGKAAAPPKGAAQVVGAAPTGPAALSRAYVAVLPLDLSPLLSNATEVSTTYGSVALAEAAIRGSAGVAAAGTDTPVWDLASILGVSGLPNPADALSAPALFDFLHITVRVTQCSQLQRPAPPTAEELQEKAAAVAAGASAAAAAPAAPAKGGKAPVPAPVKGARPASAIPASAAQADSPQPARIIPPRLFCTTVLRQLNPIIVSLCRAEDLPGIVLPAGVDRSERRFIQPDQYALLREQAVPTWALLRFPGTLEQEGKGSKQYRLLNYKLGGRPGSPPATGGTTGRQQSNESSEAELARALRVPYPPRRAIITPARAAAARVEFAPGMIASRGSKNAASSPTLQRPNPYVPPASGPSSILASRGHAAAVVCLGLLPAGGVTGLREALQTQALDVELHDRDCPAYDRVQRYALTRSLAAEAAGKLGEARPMSPQPTTPDSSAAAGGKPGIKPAAPDSKAGASREPPAPSQFEGVLEALLPRDWAWPTFALPAERLESYEAIATGGAPWPMLEQVQGSRPPSPMGGASAPSAASGSLVPNGVLYPGGKDVFDLDPIVVAECTHRALTAGDRQAHAHGRLRLEGLLDRSAERATLLARSGGRISADPRLALMPDAELVQAAGLPPLVPLSHLVEACQPLALSSSVQLMPAARRVQPKVPEPLHLLTAAQQRVIAPGAYGQTGAVLKVKVSVAHAPNLHTELLTTLPAPENPPFERAVVIFNYEDDETLQAVLAVVARVNTAALPHASSFRTYDLSPEEIVSVNAGSLDILTGVHVVDGVRRIIVLEGVAAPQGGGMQSVREALPRKGFNTRALTLLANPAVRFHARLYTAFSTCPREFHLRYPLDKIIQLPALYKPRATPVDLREALMCLANMVRATTTDEAKLMGDDAWPRVEGLSAVDRCYGDAITLSDVYGISHPAAHAVQETSERLHQATGIAEAHVPASTQHDLLLTVTMNRPVMSAEEVEAIAQAQAAAERLRLAAERHARRYARSGAGSQDSVKPSSPEETAAYMRTIAESQAARANRDYVTMNKASLQAASQRIAAERKSVELDDLAASLGHNRAAAERSAALASAGQTLDTAGKPLPGGQVFMYSGQKLNTGEWAKELQRVRLSKEKAVTFARTGSIEYGSLSLGISTVPDAAQVAVLNDKDGALSRAAWKTASGWTEGDHHTLQEDMAQAFDKARPSGFRLDQLSKPFDDPQDAEARLAASARLGAAGASGRPTFLGDPVARPSERERRGLLGYINPVSGRQDWLSLEASVHFGGDRVEEENAAKAALEHDAWKAAIVVDDTHFHAHHSKDGSARINRYGQLLEGPAASKSLGVTSSTGRAIQAPAAAPPSMFALQDVPYPGPPSGLGATLRGGSDPMSFTGRTQAGAPLDFTTVLATKDVQRGIISKVHKPLIDAATRGRSEPGVKPVLATHVRGINTDRRGE